MLGRLFRSVFLKEVDGEYRQRTWVLCVTMMLWVLCAILCAFTYVVHEIRDSVCRFIWPKTTPTTTTVDHDRPWEDDYV